MEYILHIDTSGDVGTVTISEKGTLKTLVVSKETRNHAASINTMINEVILDSGIAFTDIKAVAVCSGPGSYTGLRIAMATAKGICYANNLPLIVDDRLSLLAGAYIDHLNIGKNEHVAGILLARENEYFLVIRNGQHMNVVGPKHIEVAEMQELLRESESLHIITDVEREEFYKLSVSFLSFQEDILIDFNYWAKIAWNKLECHEYVDLMTASPLYLKQVFTRNSL